MCKFTRWSLVTALLASLTLLIYIGGAGVAKTTDQEGSSFQQSTILPRPQDKFEGRIGRTADDSVPDFPKEVKAPKDAPNVLLILTDDVGFGASSTFGGPIPTPTFDALADNGLRYNMFHTTALCSPTRAALITGRNHHSCSTGVIMEMATGYPGYNSLMPKSCGTVAEVLKLNGYNTSWFGKNHNVPDWQTSQFGPYDLWPTGLGFEYFYGFLGGDTDQWHPAAFEGTKPVEKPEGMEDMCFDEIMANMAIRWLRLQHAIAPKRPFFMYYSTGTAHAPHHAPEEWIEKFKGQFDQGWDKVREETLARQIEIGVVPEGTKLTERPKEIPAWDSLSDEQKKLYAHMMEVYAGALAHCDYQIGRVIETIDELGELDNTMIIYIQGDNGPSAEGTMQGTTNEVATAANNVDEPLDFLVSMADELGGPMTYNHYPVGWCHAMSSPFQWTKQVASHFGGTRNGMVISWPRRIKDAGGLREQFHHIIDIVPTIYEAVGIEPPLLMNGLPQKPIDGISMLYTFDDKGADSHRKTQYFELVGNRAIYHDGWVACTTPARLPWVTSGGAVNPDDFKWELYNVAEDFSQSNNVAEKYPEKLRELQELWWAEASRYNVLPLDSSFAERADPAIRPSLTRGRSEFIYYPGMVRIPEGSTPDIKNKSFTIIAEVDCKTADDSGVLATQGGRFGGWGLLMFEGKPAFVYALSNQPRHKFQIRSEKALEPGIHEIRFDFTYDGGGIGKGGLGTLTVDGEKVAEDRIPQTISTRFSLDETFDIGEDTGTPVIDDYTDRMPFKFSGDLIRLTILLHEIDENE